MYIIIPKINQLGNQLFCYAHIISNAIDNNKTLANPSFYDYAGYFKSTNEDLFGRFPAKVSFFKPNESRRKFIYRISHKFYMSLKCGKLKKFSKLGFTIVSSGSVTTLTEVSGQVNLDNIEFKKSLENKFLSIFDGPLFRDNTNIKKHRLVVRNYFRPIADIDIKVNKLLESVRQLGEVVIGVHVRRGDYRNFVDGHFFYAIDQYVEVMQSVKTLFPGKRVVFLICSDEELKLEDFKGCNVCFGLGEVVPDLYSLAECDYIIGPPSTFSGWASFYNQVPLYFIKDVAKVPSLEDFGISY